MDRVKMMREDGMWIPQKKDTVGYRYELCDKMKRLCLVFDLKTGKKLKRSKRAAKMFVYSVDTYSIKEYRAETRDYNGIKDIFGNDEVEVIIAYDGVDCFYDEEERECVLWQEIELIYQW